MILLSQMNAIEFLAYIAESIPDYAREKVKSGQWLEATSLGQAQAGFNELLPQGIATPDHHFYNLKDTVTQTSVGSLWFAVQERASEKIAYVYDVFIISKYRRTGYATRAFEALEAEVKRLGLSGIALHVFGHNAAGQALYAKLGFQPTNINMFKKTPDN
jgi:ribosomal protein S18 acetylase RimI-like enzyme